MTFRRVLLAGVLIATAVAGTHEAHACSCSWPPEAETVEARQTWRLDQAKDIVTGKVVTVTAAEGYRGAHGLPAVAATLRVDKTVKGSVKGAIKLQTGFNGEDCGLAELLMNAVANDLPVTLELARIRKAPNQFWVHSCAFHRLETR